MSRRRVLAVSVLAIGSALATSAVAGDRGYPEPRSYDQEFGNRGYVEPRGSTKDDPGPPPRVYRESAPSCVPRQVLIRRLIDDGWRDFDDPWTGGPIVVVFARRPNGEPYRLKIDRCSGEIVGLHRERGEVDFYAYEPGRWGWGAPRRWAYGYWGYGHGGRWGHGGHGGHGGHRR